ncbi:MAG: transposase [Ilumatobacter sp.]|nr:transposase [Ilumatobacter sp.]
MQILETGLEVEMDEHVGDTNHGSARCNCGNCRDGTRSKLVITEVGSVDIDVRRDRNSMLEPATVKNRQRQLNGVDSMVISPTAKSEPAHRGRG